MKPKFLIDQNMMDVVDTELASKIRSLGYEVIVSKINRLDAVMDLPSIVDDDCIVVYGSHQFINQSARGRRFHPGAYYSNNNYRCTHYYPQIPREWLANHRYILLPFGEVIRSINDIFSLWDTHALFIRPDSGAKVFAGQVIERDEADFGLDTINRLSGAISDTLCLLAPSQAISAEYRFFIVGGNVVTGSRYMVSGKPDVSTEIDHLCAALAGELARQPWQIDRAYSCDVGLIGGIPKIIELNSFSAAGLYACDIEKLFSAVAEEAMRDYEEVMSD